jgi:CDP-glucose 4,6-dehydratase
MEGMVMTMISFKNNFWLNKNVLITGHTGFKGSWLALWLKHLGANVTGVSLNQTNPNAIYHVAHVSENIENYEQDVCNLDELEKIISLRQPEIIFHMAAQSLVLSSHHDPVNTYMTNVMGTVNVLEAAKKSKTVKVFINVTTDKCYENQEWYWGYREIDQLGGGDPYSSSKACSELITTAYYRTFLRGLGTSVATVRAGNVIGGGDWSDNRLVPDAVNAILDNKQLNLRYPNATRPWQHVLDPLNGYIKLAEKLWEQPDQYSGPWNFGPEMTDIKSVRWLIDNIYLHWNKTPDWQSIQGDQVPETELLKLDISKAKSELSWQPRWGLKQAVIETVDWYKDWAEGKNMKFKCLEQIEKYENDSK